MIDDDPLMRPAAMPIANPCGLTPRDVVTGVVLGSEPRDALPAPGTGIAAADVLEEVMVPALRREPCLVSFSGGRDSSWTLAVATHAARRRGLADPVPLTITYPDRPEASEQRWQEQVVAHLGLADWERIPVTDELEALGPYALRAREEVGALFPANAYCLLPQLDAARDGALILGLGASDFYMFWHWNALSDVLARRRRPRRGDVPRLALAAMPPSLRRRSLRSRVAGSVGVWVRPDVRRSAEEAVAHELAATPVRYDAAIAHQHTFRCYGATHATIGALAATTGTTVVLPHLHPEYLAAVAAEGGRWGVGDRATAMRRTTGHLLPPEVLGRRDGANLQRVLFGDRVRAFADAWSGGGVDESLVDVDALRDGWRGETPDWRTTTLLALAARHDLPRSPEERVSAPAALP